VTKYPIDSENDTQTAVTNAISPGVKGIVARTKLNIRNFPRPYPQKRSVKILVLEHVEARKPSLEALA